MRHIDRTYTPDSWKIVEVKFPEQEKYYRVLCSWYGGFAGTDHWKLSSGVESCTVDGSEVSGAIYTLPQSSGSTYVLYAAGEHMSGLMNGVFSSFQDQIAVENDGTYIKLVTIEEMIEGLKK